MSNLVTAAKPKIIPCNCKHPAQDALHGAGNRAHNPCQRKGDTAKAAYRCTVCRSEK